MHMVVDILILGAGWTSQFLIPLCKQRSLSYAATSRSGRESTIKFDFDPNSDSHEPYHALPKAHVVLITFPITTKGASERLVRLYAQTHALNGNGLASKEDGKIRFIQLGTSGIWDEGALSSLDNLQKPDFWYDRHTPFVLTPRAEAEEELLALSPEFHTTVLNLAGLWGGTRLPKNWVARVAGSKEALKNKRSLHLIHGVDLARAVLAVCENFEKARGQRWLLTDGRLYDWWDLASAWSIPPEESSLQTRAEAEDDRGSQARWVRELMEECGVRALPRDAQNLGRALDSREFWSIFGIAPVKLLLRS